ncbi:MAG TPA: FliM/FliN family flagellar motor switch protein [Pyrinomonadaceae bacterium]
MSDSQAKQLIDAVSSAWNESAPAILGSPSSLSLLAAKEVSGDGIASALAVAMTWSAAFVASITEGASGVLICLFKSEESEEIDRLTKQPMDGLPKPGGRHLLNTVLVNASMTLSSSAPAPIAFGETSFIDLSAAESRLAQIVGNSVHIGTFSLTVGSEITSQALILHAPEGVVDAPTSQPVQNAAQAQPQNNRRRIEAAPRNIERLLDVELDVIVRFGITNVPLRDVVRMGVGTMIELNRTVDEPVELLVNGRSLARGEVVVVDGYYGVRITEIGPAQDLAAFM